MTEEIRQQQEKLLQSLSIRRNLVAQEMQELDNKKHQKMTEYNQQCNDMLKEYQSFKERLSEKKKASQDNMIKEQTERIASIQAQYDKELADLERTQSDKVKGMTENFLAYSAEIDMKRAELTKEIKEYEEKQKTIIARFKHDEEVRQQADFYRIVLTENEVSDVKKIRSIAEELHNPIILYKLIWENFYKNKFSELIGRVAGEKKCGIYKITNITNQKSYIGQTRQSFKERWRTHVKRGLKAEPTTNNKLYSSMWIDGVENFTFEILCECPAEKLNEYEKNYIQFYETMEWGYNSTGGNK